VAYYELVDWLLAKPRHGQQPDFSLRKADKKSKKTKYLATPWILGFAQP